MKKIIIGALVLLIGVPGFSFNFYDFLSFLSGLIPVLLILGGSLAVYLGLEELKQSDSSGDDHQMVDAPQAQLEERTRKVPDTQPVQAAPETGRQETNAGEQKAGEQEDEDTQGEEKTPAPAPEAAAPAETSVQFKGNIETLVFHSVTCNFASGKNCSMDFATKQEAESQGYKPCKVCMPDD